MSKQGVYKISGNTKPKVGETVTYTIDEWYPATPKEKRNPALVTWQLLKKVNGSFVPTTIKKKGISSFTFQNTAYKNTYRIEAYLHEPEGKAPMALEVQPQQSDVPRINGIQLKYADNTPGNVFSFTEKLIAESQCTGLEGKYLTFTLWEDDIQGNGHDARNMQIDRKKGKVISGVAKAEFTLTSALIKKAMQGETDVKQLEFYVTVEYYENKKHASGNVHINTPQEIYIPSNKHKPKPAPPNSQPKVEGSPAEQKGPSQKEKKGMIETTTETISGVASEVGKKIHDWAEARGTVKSTQAPTQPAPSSTSPTIVKEEKIENLLDAYFAKKEYTKQTNVEDGTHTYTFGGTKQNNKTSTDIEKNKVAQIILNKIKDNLKSQKKYTTPELISTALTAEAYGKDTVNEKTVTFKTFKLGAELKKIESALLEDKLYLVARTMLLDDKQVQIIIKEKDGLIKGSADSALPVLEITEEQMEQKANSGEVAGTEKTEFSGVVKDNLVKIPIHLRPKSDEELKQWKEKINKGKEDGDYTYKFGGPTSIKNEAEKKSIAGIILNNAKGGKRGNAKIEDGKTSSTEEIEKVLEIKDYKEGDTITFKLLKKVPELLYLNAKAQGEKQHDKEFLKKEGAYFQIGKNKLIIFPLRIKPRNDINGANKKDYWAADNSNQTNFKYSRGNRIHAARDLETDSNETVVAIGEGIVLEAQAFYRGTHQVTVHHKIPDGREFIVRYGELDPNSLLVSKNEIVHQGQELGKTGKMTGISRHMVHFELYTGSEGFEVVNYRLTQEGNPPFSRRKDLIDPLKILQEGYMNTFGENVESNSTLFTVNDGKEALRTLYNKYKNNVWNWKWDGSANEVQVTGKDVLKIVEKMYRTETRHFESGQYKNCGTGGMEVFGPPPYYGWDPTLFVENPVGTWSAYEGRGLSGAGGNEQVTDRKKEFIKFPSVTAGMEYKIKYIIKYNGNYARWFNKNDQTAQNVYRKTLKGIRARFIEEIAGN